MALGSSIADTVSRGLATAAVSGRSPVTAATAGLVHDLAAQPDSSALAYPEDFAEVVRHVIMFADPLVSDQVETSTGMPRTGHGVQTTLPSKGSQDERTEPSMISR